MLSNQEELLDLVRRLREFCRQPASASEVYAEAAALLRAIEAKSSSGGIWGLAKEVESKAEHLYCRPHLLAEAVIHFMLHERINQLEAIIRAGGERRSSTTAAHSSAAPRRRWTDRPIAPSYAS